MNIYGLVGFPLSHSYSKHYFENKFKNEHITDSVYNLYQVENISEFPLLIKNNPDIKGLNITIPYKEKIIKYIDELDKTAKDVGAVNTIKIIRKKSDSFSLIGYNTDVYGFYNSIKPLLTTHYSQITAPKALILGTGGAAKAIAHAFDLLKIEYKFVSRNPSNNDHLTYKDLNKEIFGKYQIIVNCTPVGMYPDVNDFPDIPYDFINEQHMVCDLIYNPTETMFLKNAKEKHAIIQNGLPMLYLQADMSWKIWNS